MVHAFKRGCVVVGLVSSLACVHDGEVAGAEAPSGFAPTALARSTVPADAVPYFPDQEWRTANPEDVGIPSGVLARVDQRIAANTWRGLHSFVVVRHGYLVREGYFGGSSRDDVHTMQSVSKSVTSLVAGIASDRGALDV